jgi:hypothetical protein
MVALFASYKVEVKKECWRVERQFPNVMGLMLQSSAAGLA